MCVVCGCGNDIEHPVAPAAAGGDLHYGRGPAGSSVPGLDAGRVLRLEADVLGANDRFAAANRAHFAAHGVAAWNLVSSPGAGKTTLLCRTLAELQRRAPGLALAVIEGDQQTTLDAERIRATGVPAIQVNTGRGCHLDARMVGEAFARLPMHGHAHVAAHDHPHDHPHTPGNGPPQGLAHASPALLFIENVGNLVCPALWDLGERGKLVMLSVTEGEDKPLKYPDMFAAARLMVLTKTDLLPLLDFDVARCIAHAHRVNPGIEVLLLSARNGVGIDAWVDWLLADAAAPAQQAGSPRAEGVVPACHR